MFEHSVSKNRFAILFAISSIGKVSDNYVNNLLYLYHSMGYNIVTNLANIVNVLGEELDFKTP